MTGCVFCPIQNLGMFNNPFLQNTGPSHPWREFSVGFAGNESDRLKGLEVEKTTILGYREVYIFCGSDPPALIWVLEETGEDGRGRDRSGGANSSEGITG